MHGLAHTGLASLVTRYPLHTVYCLVRVDNAGIIVSVRHVNYLQNGTGKGMEARRNARVVRVPKKKGNFSVLSIMDSDLFCRSWTWR
jgi:hypothetical protein